MRARSLAATLTLAVMLVCVGSSLASADAVDDAFAQGEAAANESRWADAIAAWKEAARLLPQPNAAVEYALGTAYAHAGDLGRATFHLRRSLDPRLVPSSALAEHARSNLEEVRRRAELQAAATGAQIDRPAGWWDSALDGLRSTWVGWLALGAGLAALLGLGVLRRRRRANRAASSWVSFVTVAGLTWAGVGLLHGLALRADSVAPQAIVLPSRAEVRERPGAHAQSPFAVSGGTRVRLVDESPGWRRVRLPGGLEGWVPEAAVAELEPLRSAL